MKDDESIQGFLSKVSRIVSHIRTHCKVVTNKTIVNKVLRSLTNKYIHIVTAIEESKDLSTYTFDELMSSLIAH